MALVGLLCDEALESAGRVVDAIALDDFFAAAPGFEVGGGFGLGFGGSALRGEFGVCFFGAGFGVGC